ncbi:hypothetical protein AB4Y63_10525 [Leifsonia sp. YAF41]|uniref:hypothetical protein n=1 Tax=Leifsonia sp. YAF41 TaxID=3233086 RepID=UPI003F96650C
MKILRNRLRLLSGDYTGLGLVEILISMLILALLAVAFLPLLLNTLQLGPKNAAIAAGNQLVADGLTRAEAQGLASCMNVQSLSSSFPTSAATTASAIEYGISVTFVPGSCPAGPLEYPSTIEVLVTAVQYAGTPNSRVLTKARQLIYVALP